MADPSPTPSFWKDMDVYVTGGTGFIGTEVVSALADAGAKLTCLTRSATTPRAKRLADMGCTLVEGSVTDPDAIDVGDATTVLHGAAWVALGLPKRKGKRERFWATNVTGTEHVLAAAREAGVKRFCHLSSVAAVGATPSGLYDEDRAVEGRVPTYKSFYEETKHAAHLHVLEHAGKMRTTLPMPGVVLGNGSDTEALLEAYLRGRFWSVKDDNPTAFVHVRDVADGIVRGIERGDGPYILVDQNLLIDQLLDLFQEASGAPRPQRALSMRTLKLGAWLIEKPFHLAGKVPPASTELVRSLEVPLTYSSKRAAEELEWVPDLVGQLTRDFEQIKARSNGRGGAG